MNPYIFSKDERRLLEDYLTNINDKDAVQKLLAKIKENKTLFEDVYLYLQIKKSTPNNG
jgi:hypothetical protein